MCQEPITEMGSCMCTVKLKVLGREPVVRQIQKKPLKKTLFKCGQKNMWRRIPHNAAVQYPEERVI